MDTKHGKAFNPVSVQSTNAEKALRSFNNHKLFDWSTKIEKIFVNYWGCIDTKKNVPDSKIVPYNRKQESSSPPKIHYRGAEPLMLENKNYNLFVVRGTLGVFDF